MSHICVVGALPRSLVNFRGHFISELIRRGHRVTAMAAPATAEEVRDITALGAAFRPFPIQRNRLNPVRDALTFVALRRAFRELHPDVVVAYTIKPVIWGSLALGRRRRPNFFALITGLGYVFDGSSAARRSLTLLVTRLYRRAFLRADTVIFQNTDNRDVFVSRGIVSAHKSRVVGSGVDLTRFAVRELPASGAVFLLIARLLGEKGVREYVDAVRVVKQRHPESRFELVGPIDSSPDAIPIGEVRGWDAEGIIEYRGESHDVRPFLNACHIYVLPSYHEGMPRTVLEAMATGRPILTTNVPGCRETVVAGENGFLVPRGDAGALADRMLWFLTNRDQWSRMGAASRRIAEEQFDIRRVTEELLRTMRLDAGPAT